MVWPCLNNFYLNNCWIWNFLWTHRNLWIQSILQVSLKYIWVYQQDVLNMILPHKMSHYTKKHIKYMHSIILLARFNKRPYKTFSQQNSSNKHSTTRRPRIHSTGEHPNHVRQAVYIRVQLARYWPSLHKLVPKGQADHRLLMATVLFLHIPCLNRPQAGHVIWWSWKI